jgi:uncharacterized protein
MQFEDIEAKAHVAVSQLVGNATLTGKLGARDFVDEHCGLPTVKDILAELVKPGRAPHSEFKVANSPKLSTIWRI